MSDQNPLAFVSQVDARAEIPCGRGKWYELIERGLIPKPTIRKFPGSRETGYSRKEWNEILAALREPIAEAS